MTVVYGLLGEVTARVDGRPVDLGPARQRCVLAALAVEVDRVVPVDRLVERLWGADPPRRARPTLYSYISRLRQVLGTADLVRRSGGYLLAAPQQAVDLHRFRDLCARARAEHEDDLQVVALLTEALGLWRGEALTGLEGEWAEAERERLAGERLAAELDLTDARLRLGQGENLVAELSARAAEHPLDERVAGQYMLALHRAGRVADALAHYRRTHARLVEELGTDPGTALRDLHRRILDADPTLYAQPRDREPEPVAVPRQLPPAPPHFTGRATELTALTLALDTAAPEGGTAVVSAIAGAGGIGKTWLALHWAHHHAHRFPDGQLFVDLQGFSPTSAPMDPATAVRGFLDALGVDPRSIPPDPQAQAGLYRSLVADKRMLIVADNARDAAQVVPLLPGSSTCAMLVTSRNRLTELLTRHGTSPLRVDVLSDEEALQVLTERLGADRVDAEPEAVRELLAWCAGYPLALGIVAGRATTHPGFPLAVLAAELRDTATRLEVLADDNPATSLPAVLSWSHNALTAEQARVFALLGLAPGTDLGLHAAADLTGLPTTTTRTVLRALEDMHLLQQHTPGRWRMHDLIRLYAADRARQDLAEADREAALCRLVGHYVHTAHSADRLLHPHRPPIRLAAPNPGQRTHPLADQQAALDWFTTEHTNLLAVQRLAADRDRHTAAWQLAWSMDTFLYRRGHLHDAVAVWRTGQAAAEHDDDPAVHTVAHRLLGAALTYAGLLDSATHHLDRALALAERTGDRLAQAHTHRSLAQVCERQGYERRALEHAVRALDLYQGLGLPALEALALNAVGWYQARVGAHDQARAHCTAALALARRHGHREIEAATLDSLGYIAHRTGQHTPALDHYRQALTLFHDLGDTYEEAATLDRIGLVHHDLGEHDQARAAWRRALAVYQAQHRTRDAQRVQHQLDELDQVCGHPAP